MTGAVRAAIAGAVLTLGACAALLGVDRVDYDAGPDAAEGGAGCGAAGCREGAAADAAYDTTAALDARKGSECPGDGGPSMVDAEGFCIDTTEVTVAQYRAFLEATQGNTSGQPAVCAWNGSYLPQLGWPPDAGSEALPVVGVDWCDALAFCAWAGKRLCGAIGGGEVFNTPERKTNPTVDQWYHACSHGFRLYPYGDMYEPDWCNTSDLDAGGRVAVGSLRKCVGGHDGLFDMVGNVDEWEDSCDSDGGRTDHCQVRGGSFRAATAVGSVATCTFLGTAVERQSTWPDLGIRCCAP
jgi:formylglycine-generating enzyme required for sulfatase activity